MYKYFLNSYVPIRHKMVILDCCYCLFWEGQGEVESVKNNICIF